VRILLRLCLQRWLGVLTRWLMGPHAVAILVRTPHGVFAVDPRDSVVGRQLRQAGRYGENEIDRIASLTDAQSRVLFVGAHVGALALPVAGMVKEVVAVEANPVSYELLQLNISMNRIRNCTAINTVAAEKAGTVEFLLNTANSGGSKRRPRKRRAMYYYDNPQTVVLQSAPLDEVLPAPGFDCILMDIEGSEFFALLGMPRLLANSRALLMEFIPHHLRNVSGVGPNDLFALLEPHFKSVFIPSKGIRTDMAGARAILNEMFERNEEDEGILFQKAQENR
jgi:FkbM family methyltransferase